MLCNSSDYPELIQFCWFFKIQMTNGHIDYIPYQKALVLEGQTEEEELKKELEQLQKMVGDRFNSLIHRFDVLEVRK